MHRHRYSPGPNSSVGAVRITGRVPAQSADS